MKSEDNKGLNELLSYHEENIHFVQDEISQLTEMLGPLRSAVPQEASDAVKDIDVGYDLGNTVYRLTEKVKSISEQLRILRQELSL